MPKHYFFNCLILYLLLNECTVPTKSFIFQKEFLFFFLQNNLADDFLENFDVSSKYLDNFYKLFILINKY